MKDMELDPGVNWETVEGVFRAEAQGHRFGSPEYMAAMGHLNYYGTCEMLRRYRESAALLKEGQTVWEALDAALQPAEGGSHELAKCIGHLSAAERETLRRLILRHLQGLVVGGTGVEPGTDFNTLEGTLKGLSHRLPKRQ